MSACIFQKLRYAQTIWPFNVQHFLNWRKPIFLGGMHKHSRRSLPFLFPILTQSIQISDPSGKTDVRMKFPYLLTCKHCNCRCPCIWGTSNHPILPSLPRALHICKRRQSIHPSCVRRKKKWHKREEMQTCSKGICCRNLWCRVCLCSPCSCTKRTNSLFYADTAKVKKDESVLEFEIRWKMWCGVLYFFLGGGCFNLVACFAVDLTSIDANGRWFRASGRGERILCLVVGFGRGDCHGLQVSWVLWVGTWKKFGRFLRLQFFLSFKELRSLNLVVGGRSSISV